MLRNLHSGVPPNGGDAFDFIGDEGLIALWTHFERPVRAELLKPLRTRLAEADYDLLMDDTTNPVWDGWLVNLIRPFFCATNVDGWRNLTGSSTYVPSSTSFRLREGNAMDTRVNRADNRQNSEDIEFGKLAKLANEKPKEFGSEVLGLLNAFNIKVDKLATAFGKRGLLPADVRNLMPWLQAHTRPSWTVAHMQEILDVVDSTPKYFCERLKKEVAVPSGAAESVSSSTKPEPRIEKVHFSSEQCQTLALLQVKKKPFVAQLSAELKQRKIDADRLAKVFALEHLTPREPLTTGKWLAGEIDYQLTFAHHGLLAALMMVSATDYVAIFVEKLPAPTAQLTPPRAGMVKAELTETTVTSQPETTREYFKVVDGEREAFGNMLKALIEHIGKSQADLHRHLLADGLIGTTPANISHLLSGRSYWNKDRYDSTAAFFGVEPSALDEAYRLTKANDPKAFAAFAAACVEGKDAAAGPDTTVETVAEEPLAETPDAPVDAVADMSSSEEPPAAVDEPETETVAEATAAETVTEPEVDVAAEAATEAVAETEEPRPSLEDAMEEVFRDYDAQSTVGAEPEALPEDACATEPAVKTVGAVQKADVEAELGFSLAPRGVGLAAYSPEELGMLKLAYEQLEAVPEPQRAEALLQLAKDHVDPELLSRHLFAALLEQGGNLEGLPRRKLMGDVYVMSLASV